MAAAHLPHPFERAIRFPDERTKNSSRGGRCDGRTQILGRDRPPDMPDRAPIAHEAVEVKPCNGSMQRALASKLPSHFAKRGRHGAAARRVDVAALWMEFGDEHTHDR